MEIRSWKVSRQLLVVGGLDWVVPQLGGGLGRLREAVGGARRSGISGIWKSVAKSGPLLIYWCWREILGSGQVEMTKVGFELETRSVRIIKPEGGRKVRSQTGATARERAHNL